MHPAAKFLLQQRQLRTHAFARRLSPYDEASLLVSTIVRESQEVEGFRCSLATRAPVGLGETPELDYSRLIWVQIQPEFRQPPPELMEEPLAIFLVLENPPPGE
jgi:hypothetical protein